MQTRLSDRLRRLVRRHPFLRLLLLDRHLRIALAALAAAVTALLGLLPKAIRVTPAEVTPEIRVSGLDWLQARWFDRLAERTAAGGRLEDALHFWNLALANHPGDVAVIRRIADAITAAGQERPNHFRWGATYLPWLLRLSATNTADVARAVRYFEAQGRPYPAVEYLRDHLSSLSREEARAALPALVEAGELGAFDSLWRRLEVDSWAEAPLKASQAAWVLAAQREENPTARKLLLEAANSPELGPLAWRLLLCVGEARGDAQLFEAGLAPRQRSGNASLREEVALARLLVRKGKRDQALALLRAPKVAAQDAQEIGEVVDLFFELRCDAEAETMLQLHQKIFANAPELWVRRMRLRMRANQWEELRMLAVEMRTALGNAPEVAEGSRIFEALAMAGLGRAQSAEDAWRLAEPALGNLGPLLAVEISAAFRNLNQPIRALAVMNAAATRSGDWVAVWEELHRAALAAGDNVPAIHAAERLVQLEPENSIRAHDLAATLLACHEQTARAAALTAQLFAANSTSLSTGLNHGLALAQNGRVEEAAELLASIRLSEATPEQQTVLHLTRLECALQRGELEEGRREIEQIDASSLPAMQVRWLNLTRPRVHAAVKRR